MPLLDSFKVDHTKMKVPAVRLAKTMTTPHQDIITVYDLRFTQPNQEILSEAGSHTVEHLFAGFMRDHLNSATVEIIDISPMGCRTGFYMSIIGSCNEVEVGNAWRLAMQDILNVPSQDQIPELNKYQCGTYKMHSLAQAKEIASKILSSEIGVNKNADILLSNDFLG